MTWFALYAISSYVMSGMTCMHVHGAHALNKSGMSEIPVRTSTVHTLSLMSVIAPIDVSFIPPVHPSDNKCQEIMEEFSSTNYGRNTQLK